MYWLGDIVFIYNTEKSVHCCLSSSVRLLFGVVDKVGTCRYVKAWIRHPHSSQFFSIRLCCITIDCCGFAAVMPGSKEQQPVWDEASSKNTEHSTGISCCYGLIKSVAYRLNNTRSGILTKLDEYSNRIPSWQQWCRCRKQERVQIRLLDFVSPCTLHSHLMQSTVLSEYATTPLRGQSSNSTTLVGYKLRYVSPVICCNRHFPSTTSNCSLISAGLCSSFGVVADQMDSPIARPTVAKNQKRRHIKPITS